MPAPQGGGHAGGGTPVLDIVGTLFTPVAAGSIIRLSNFGYVVGCSMGGWLSDRVFSSRRRIVLIGLSGMALSELALTLYCGCSHIMILACIFFCLGLFAGFGNVMYAHIKGIMPLEMSGMALTGINFFTMLAWGSTCQSPAPMTFPDDLCHQRS